MNDIDQVSKALGRLQAEAESSHNQRVEIFKKLDGLTVQVTAMVGSVDQLVTMVGTHSDDLKVLNALKHKALGWVAAVGVMGGGLGAFVNGMLHPK